MNRMRTEDEEVKLIGNEERAFVCSMYTIGSSHSNHNARNSNGDTRKSTNVRVPTYIKARCKQSYCTVVVVISVSTVNAFPPT